jgi:hypothetical protein
MTTNDEELQQERDALREEFDVALAEWEDYEARQLTPAQQRERFANALVAPLWEEERS